MTTRSDKATTVTNGNGKQPDARTQALLDRLEVDDEFLVGALLYIYSFQTDDEKASETTRYDNSVGFNAVDAGILSSFAEFYKRTGFLSEKQLSYARRLMKKYTRQMDEDLITPLAIKGRVEKKTKQIEKSMTVKLGEENKLIVKFSFPKGDPQFGETLKNVKTLEGRRWNPEEKAWTVPKSLMALKSLIYWGFTISEELQKWHDQLIIDISSLKPLKPKLREGMKLRPFQELGIAFIEKAKGRGIIGDVMGLGKTVQALGWLSLHPEALPALVICPSNIKYNWEREIKKWLPDDFKVRVLSGRLNGDLSDPDFIDKFHEDITKTIFVINYDIISNKTSETTKLGKVVREEIRNTGWGDFLKNVHMMTIILDEFHYIKNSKALRTKAAKRLARNADYILALSGTPIINRPVEFFNGIEMINPDIFPGWWYYVHKFCGAYHDGYGLVVNGHSNEDKLHKILTSTVMIRREKKDVYDQLPEKNRAIIPIPMVDREGYEDALRELNEFLSKKYNNSAALVEIEKLKQMAVRSKMEAAIDWIRDFLESDEKLILFADHHFVVDELMEEFKDVAVKIDGGTPDTKRMDIVDAFQKDDKVKLFIGTKAAKEGITLDAASNVAFMELWWTPGDHDQAEDRCYGRLSDPHGANVWYLVAMDTIEEEIALLLDKKRTVIGAVLDGKPMNSPSILTELIEAVKNK